MFLPIHLCNSSSLGKSDLRLKSKLSMQKLSILFPRLATSRCHVRYDSEHKQMNHLLCLQRDVDALHIPLCVDVCRLRLCCRLMPTHQHYQFRVLRTISPGVTVAIELATRIRKKLIAALHSYNVYNTEISVHLVETTFHLHEVQPKTRFPTPVTSSTKQVISHGECESRS